eukprot:scaffold258_cov134-Isochrysis_galbana.AAC.2
MAHWKALSKGFPTVPGAGFVDGRLGSVSIMHCEWARVSVVFRLSGLRDGCSAGPRIEPP